MTEREKVPWNKTPEGKAYMREYCRTYMRYYYEKHPEKMPYRAHPHKYKEYQRAWWAKHPHYWTERKTRNHTNTRDKP